MPVGLTVGVGVMDDVDIFPDIIIGVGVGNGLPMLHITCGEATVIGAILNVAVAMN